MIRLLIPFLVAASVPSLGLAEMVTTTKMVRPQSIISAGDLALAPETIPGAFASMSEVVGLEARVALYPGRPIRAGDVGPPALVDRNDLITIVYSRGGLEIETVGRSLGRAGAGEALRVLNMESRTMVSGRVTESGRVAVGN